MARQTYLAAPGIARALKPRLAEQQGSGQPSEAAAPGRSPRPQAPLCGATGARQPGEAVAQRACPAA
ncbi:hypothetical protein [Paenibacillus amylolyticus]|uniref:hypothetical protein n=1 Tax=Paenibacillus amylolyticus TaxID=1451 RepID=UPI003D95B863